ncbi:MAG: hypothetical protein K5839_04495 [Treponemataceae bacterium]|nr:hypothetical protein [Treponemataceae bacterium]
MNTGSVSRMKKILVIVAIFSLVLISCATNSKLVEEKPVAGIDDLPFSAFSMGHSYLTEKNIGEKVTVTGLFLQNESGFVLLENSDSKSRVSFILEFDKKKKFQLSSYVNQKVEISGVLTSAESPWKKGLKVESIRLY